jgi:hypothetical protein
MKVRTFLDREGMAISQIDSNQISKIYDDVRKAEASGPPFADNSFGFICMTDQILTQ